MERQRTVNELLRVALTTAMPSGHEAVRTVSPSLRATNPRRLRYRVRLIWTDDTAPSGQRTELHAFGSARSALDLLRRVAESPARPLVDVRVECICRPRWESVPVNYLRWRAQQREAKGGAR